MKPSHYTCQISLLLYRVEIAISVNMKPSAGNLAVLLLCFVQWVSAATVYFPITLSWANQTVAGVTRPVILTNGQFPGPELRLKQNDEVIFDVKNFCPFTVTVHFHGKSSTALIVLTTGFQ